MKRMELSEDEPRTPVRWVCFTRIREHRCSTLMP
jgi:hypothetical protein